MWKVQVKRWSRFSEDMFEEGFENIYGSADLLARTTFIDIVSMDRFSVVRKF